MPAIVLFALGILYPFSYALRTSFMDRNELFWVGTSNYKDILLDPLFWRSMSFTTKYLLFVATIELCIGTGLALAVSSQLRGEIWRGVFIAPMFVVPVATGVIWRLIFHPTVGVANYILSFLSIPGIDWLTKPIPAFFAVSIMDIWQWTPFIFLMVYAAVDVIPRDMYEAAAIDGANSFQTFKFLTLPWIRNTLIFSFALRGLEVLKVFDHIYSSTNGGSRIFNRTHLSVFI